MAIKFTNNASATLAASITSTQTSVSLTTGQGALFPTLTAPDYFYVTFSDSANNLEIAKVTARTGDTLTVSRGQDGTVGQTFSAGDKCELRFTAAGITDLGAGLNITDLPANTTMAGVGIVTTTATQTLTNKTLTSPTVNSGTFSGGTFSGTPTAPTATAGTNNTQIASTAFVSTALANYFPSGTRILFQQTAAPTGWTKDTTHNDKALRVVNGAASSGGSVGFTSAFASQAVAGTVGSTTLGTNEIPSHTHTFWSYTTAVKGSTGIATRVSSTSTTPTINFSVAGGATGGGGSHNHSFSGTAINLAVQYVDVIIAAKD
jgi:hypothetical protein